MCDLYMMRAANTTTLHTQSIRHSLDTEHDGPGAAVNDPGCGDYEGHGLHNFYVLRSGYPLQWH